MDTGERDGADRHEGCIGTRTYWTTCRLDITAEILEIQQHGINGEPFHRWVDGKGGEEALIVRGDRRRQARRMFASRRTAQPPAFAPIGASPDTDFRHGATTGWVLAARGLLAQLVGSPGDSRLSSSCLTCWSKRRPKQDAKRNPTKTNRATQTQDPSSCRTQRVNLASRKPAMSSTWKFRERSSAEKWSCVRCPPLAS